MGSRGVSEDETKETHQYSVEKEWVQKLRKNIDKMVWPSKKLNKESKRMREWPKGEKQLKKTNKWKLYYKQQGVDSTVQRPESIKWRIRPGKNSHSMKEDKEMQATQR